MAAITSLRGAPGRWPGRAATPKARRSANPSFAPDKILLQNQKLEFQLAVLCREYVPASDARKQDYDFGDPWPEERDRFMAADRQEAGGEHYWYVIRAFGPFGQSRLVTYGRCATREQLEELRKQYNVPVANAMLDSGFKASEVYRFCLATGWKAFKGDDTEYFRQRRLSHRGAIKNVARPCHLALAALLALAT